MVYIGYMEKAPAMKFFFAALAALAIVGPANATITADGPTAARIFRDMDNCGKQAYDQDYNKFRAKFDACIRGIEGWTHR